VTDRRVPLPTHRRRESGCAPPAKRYRHSYGVWLAFVVARNSNQSTVSGVDHFHPEELCAFLQALESRLAPCSILSFLVNLRVAVRALHQGQSLSVLDRAIQHYKRTATRDKQGRMQAVYDLRELGVRLMSECKRGTAGCALPTATAMVPPL
jgi:hypothetical protein